MKPYKVSITQDVANPRIMDVVIHATDQQEAQKYARNYFGDFRVDYRNRNVVTYVCSDFDFNHTYHVEPRVGERA